MNLIKCTISLLLKVLLMKSINNVVFGQSKYHDATRMTYETIQVSTARPGLRVNEQWNASSINGKKCENVQFFNGKLNFGVNSTGLSCTLKSPYYDFKNFKGNAMVLVTAYELETVVKSMDAELTVFLIFKNDIRKKINIKFDKQKTEFDIDVESALKFVKFEFVVRDFYGSFSNIKVQYFECNPEERNNVEFPESATFVTNEKPVNGSCMRNTVLKNPSKTPFLICMKNGTYVVDYGDGCKCKKGYETFNNACSGCSSGYFKNKFDACQECGRNSESTLKRDKCDCKKGFSRLLIQRNISSADCFVKNEFEISSVTTLNSISLKWNDNSPHVNGKYIIRCKECPRSIFTQTNRTLKISDLQPSTQYTITITKINFQDKEISTESFKFKTKKAVTEVTEDKFKWVIIAGSVVGGLIVIIIILVIIIVYKRQFPDQFEVSRMEDGTMKTERRKLFSTSRIYVDPTTYSQVDDAVQEFTLEIDRKYITTDHLLGGGEFANVFKGILSTQSRNTDVAIKIMKHGACKTDRDDFLSEAAILGQFSDPNVITIEGVVLKDQPNMIVLEYMENGSLDKYLVKNDSQLSIQKLLGMARGVASGMKYLAELGYIHRDLAARNVLVNNEGVCKIADFGMSRELKTDDTYDTKGGKIPIKWTAPEAIQYKKFTTASDVWSYGILMWEIFSFGERPYWEWNNLEVMERLSTGYRLPPPMECPKVIHDLMLKCWHNDRMKRPRFNAIFDKLEDWLKKPELLTEIASVITRRDEDLDYSVMEDLASWLGAIKMDQYLKMFTESGYITPKDVLYLTNEDLESLGVGILGHRKKLLKAIRNTRLQVEDGRRVRSSSGSTTNSKVSRSTSSGGFGTLTKKVSILTGQNSISFKKTIGKRPSLQGYKLT